MADYGFVHAGQVFTPNGTINIDVAENDARNRAIEQAELAEWRLRPTEMLAYYEFPAHRGGGLYRPQFTVVMREATVKTGLGTTIGVITTARVWKHNLGGRFVSMRVKGTNGAWYYGRASWDNGTCVRLRRVK